VKNVGKTRIFIASSTKGLELAEAIRSKLQSKERSAKVWSDPDTFELSGTTIGSLEKQLQHTDFAIIAVTPDDLVTAKGKRSQAPRDNVIFETGLFMGRIGRGRTFVMWPSKSKIKKPSDWSGITTAVYENDENNSTFKIDAACKKILDSIKRASPTLLESILSKCLLPERVLLHCRDRFDTFTARPNRKPVFDCDAQLTTCKSDGVITYHPHPSAKGHDAKKHRGQVLWASFKRNSKWWPFEAIIRSEVKSGWLVWIDAGYTKLKVPIAGRSHTRVCIGFFQRTENEVYILEIHQEVEAPLPSFVLPQVARILAKRIEDLEEQLAK